jgi:hypothetical protein
MDHSIIATCVGSMMRSWGWAPSFFFGYSMLSSFLQKIYIDNTNVIIILECMHACSVRQWKV